MLYRVLPSVVLVVAALVPGALAASAHRGYTLGPNACHISMPDIEAKDVCFSPARVSVAEHRMALPPVAPGQVIWGATGLRLRHVMLRISREPFDIEYLYGRMPLSRNLAMPNPSGASPKYVLLSQMIYLDTNPIPRPYNDGFWFESINVVCKHLAFTLETNLSASLEKKIMRGLLGRVSCGKQA
jgi:hypothetical protein